jgi:hypothetical protein
MSFDQFWALFPRKVAKLAAQKAWEKNGCDTIADKILASLRKQVQHWTDPKFIPHPATWLNAGRWDDEPMQELRPGPARPTQNTYNPPPQQDGWKANLNRVLLALIYEAHGVPDDVMARLLKGRDYYAHQFREMWGESAPRDEFGPIMENVVTAFRKVIRGQA